MTMKVMSKYINLATITKHVGRLGAYFSVSVY